MITSSSNNQIKNIIALLKKPKERRKQDLFVVEGIKMCMETPQDHLEGIYVSDSFYRKPENAVFLEKHRFEVVSDSVFNSISDTRTPQGVLCLVKQFHYKPEELIRHGYEKEGSTHPPLCMILENLQDPGNLGTIFRTAEGAGVTGILLSSDSVDLTNPKVIRSTMGSAYRMPFAYTEDLHGTIREWKKQGIRTYAAHLKGKEAYDKENYTGASAFMIGNESQGLTEETASLADCYIRIPMAGQVESLNAAVASAILMYEASRQRRNEE